MSAFIASVIIAISNLYMLSTQKSAIYLLIVLVSMFCFISSACSLDKPSQPTTALVNSIVLSAVLGILVSSHILYGNQVLDYLLLTGEVSVLLILSVFDIFEPSDVASEGSIFS